ncbi:MFS general substrate transporter [Rhodotorula sp. JG-1b]|nr:MFS general substrate transporter [Rhodotorula sp. JG-1b]
MADVERNHTLEDEKYRTDHVEKSDAVPIESSIQPPARMFTPEEEDKLYRKVDYRIMPILSGNIGNARIEGLEAELNMNSQQFNTTLSCFFITYCLCEVPANLIMKKFRRPSHWLGLVTTTWAIVMTLMGVVQSYGGLLAARLALGVAEAGLFPGVILYLSIWYPRHRSQSRVAFFFGAATLAGAFSGLLAYGIGFMSGVGGYAGWRWIFILEGLATFVAGIASFWAISDYPQDCKWLTKEEADWLIYKKAIDSGVHGETEEVSWTYVRQALTSWQTYLSVLYYFGVVVPLYAISLISPTLIQAFGRYTRPQVQLLTVPMYAVACIFVVVTSILADRQKTRFRYMMLDLILCFFGLIINLTPAPVVRRQILWTLPHRDGRVSGPGFFTFSNRTILTPTCPHSYGGLPTSVTWLTNNTSGQTKRAISSAFQIGIGNLGALASSNVYRTQDKPHYYLGHGVVLGFNVIGLIAAPTYAYLLKRANARKLEEQKTGRDLSIAETLHLGDRAPHFMYTI